MAHDMQSMTKEEKERRGALAMQKMREKNQEFMKRHEEVEADRLFAEATNSSITNTLSALGKHSSLDSKRAEEKLYSYEEWKAERNKIEEERFARASANRQRAWDMHKLKQEDESREELKSERNPYRGRKQAQSFPSWRRKVDDNIYHEREYKEKHHGSDTYNNPPRSKQSFRYDRRVNLDNEKSEFSHLKQDKTRKYAGFTANKGNPHQHEINPCIDSKAYEGTGKYDQRPHGSLPFRKGVSYRQNRHGGYEEEFNKPFKHNENRHVSYNKPQFNKGGQNSRKVYRSDSSFDNVPCDLQTEVKTVSHRGQPDDSRSHFPKTGIRNNHGKTVDQYSYSSTKGQSEACYKNSKAARNVIVAQCSGTWSDCDDNEIISSAFKEPMVEAKYPDALQKDCISSGIKSSTWSDEDDVPLCTMKEPYSQKKASLPYSLCDLGGKYEGNSSTGSDCEQNISENLYKDADKEKSLNKSSETFEPTECSDPPFHFGIPPDVEGGNFTSAIYPGDGFLGDDEDESSYPKNESTDDQDSYNNSGIWSNYGTEVVYSQQLSGHGVYSNTTAVFPSSYASMIMSAPLPKYPSTSDHSDFEFGQLGIWEDCDVVDPNEILGAKKITGKKHGLKQKGCKTSTSKVKKKSAKNESCGDSGKLFQKPTDNSMNQEKVHGKKGFSSQTSDSSWETISVESS